MLSGSHCCCEQSCLVFSILVCKVVFFLVLGCRLVVNLGVMMMHSSFTTTGCSCLPAQVSAMCVVGVGSLSNIDMGSMTVLACK